MRFFDFVMLVSSFDTLVAGFERPQMLITDVRFGPKADMATSCAGFFADPNTAAEFAADD
jgi:hypothetical protein